MNPIDPAGFQGWSVGEAIEALVPRSVLEAWRAAEQRLKELPSSSGWSLVDSGLRDSIAANTYHRDRRVIAQRGEEEASARVFRVLKDLGFQGRIVGVGRPDKNSAPQELIERDRWLGFSEFDEEQSLVAHGNDGFLSVVVYPLLVSPLASEAIAGRRLSDILCDFVLRDPEIETLCEAAQLAPAALCNLVGGPDGAVCLVPVSDSVREIERALQNVPIEAVRPVLALRLAALGRLLYGNNLALIGFREGDQAEDKIEISSIELRRPSMRLCIATGDLWQEKDRARHRLFHSLQIERLEAGASQPVSLTAERGAAPTKAHNLGGTSPQYDWDRVVPCVISELMMGSGSIRSQAELFRLIEGKFAELGLLAQPSSETIKTHMEKKHRPLLQAISARKGAQKSSP